MIFLRYKMALTALSATIILLFSQCLTNKAIDGNADLVSHPQPLKIHSVGAWKQGYLVLTMIDAKGNYFITVKPYSDSLVKGRILNYSK